MAIRTTSSDVIALMTPGGDYDTVNLPSLTGFIATANAVVNRVATCATAKGMALSTEELELIERWLSAHYYVMSDQNYTSKTTDGASASFQGKTDMGVKASKYGQTALDLDYSGCLAAITTRAFASFSWLGKNPRDQIDVEDR